MTEYDMIGVRASFSAKENPRRKLWVFYLVQRRVNTKSCGVTKN